jgi:hypothetical protein
MPLTLRPHRPRCCGGGDLYRLVRYWIVGVNDWRFQTQSGLRFAGVWSEVLDLQSQSVKCRLAGHRKRTAGSGPALLRPLATDSVRNSSSTAGFTRHVVPACLPCRQAARTRSCRVACISDLRNELVALEVCKLQATSAASEVTQGLRSSTVSEVTQTLGSVSRMKHLRGVRVPPTATGLELKPGLTGSQWRLFEDNGT